LIIPNIYIETELRDAIENDRELAESLEEEDGCWLAIIPPGVSFEQQEPRSV
jgi:hypothetical protein